MLQLHGVICDQQIIALVSGLGRITYATFLADGASVEGVSLIAERWRDNAGVAESRTAKRRGGRRGLGPAPGLGGPCQDRAASTPPILLPQPALHLTPFAPKLSPRERFVVTLTQQLCSSATCEKSCPCILHPNWVPWS